MLDGIAILLLIAMLGVTLTALFSTRNPAAAARAKSWLRGAVTRLNSALLSPKEAEAGAALLPEIHERKP